MFVLAEPYLQRWHFCSLKRIQMGKKLKMALLSNSLFSDKKKISKRNYLCKNFFHKSNLARYIFGFFAIFVWTVVKFVQKLDCTKQRRKSHYLVIGKVPSRQKKDNRWPKFRRIAKIYEQPKTFKLKKWLYALYKNS